MVKRTVVSPLTHAVSTFTATTCGRVSVRGRVAFHVCVVPPCTPVLAFTTGQGGPGQCCGISLHDHIVQLLLVAIPFFRQRVSVSHLLRVDPLVEGNKTGLQVSPA